MQVLHGCLGGAAGAVYNRQQEVIERCIDHFCERHPKCRSFRNVKGAWDLDLIDMAMRLLLVWDLFGHCNRSSTAWPFFARMTLGMLFYLGWRPFQLTRDVDHNDARWQDHPILSSGMCHLTCLADRPASLFVNGLRTKFYRNPRPVLNQYSQELEDRVVCDGKLTYAPAVDVCPVLAWVAWAVMNGMFGFAPLIVMNGTGIV